MKKLTRMIAILFCMLLFCGCSLNDLLDDEEETKATTNQPKETEPRAEIDVNARAEMVKAGAIREPQVQLKGNGEDKVTILVYMNGSNLETDDGAATRDLTEILAAGSSDKVNVLIQTMGTKKWNTKYGIASDRSQIYSVESNGLTLVNDNLGQLDCTDPKTLSDFIKWGVSMCPADRYILLFWDHGGGPVYGFGYDDNKNDKSATLDAAELGQALGDAKVYFDFIGLDCCIMSSLEVCCATYDYCDYMIMSEDFESGLGWSYTEWLKKLYANTSIPTVELGKVICDSMVDANEKEIGGDKAILSVIDQSMLKVLYSAWTEFAYANESALLGTNYSKDIKHKNGGRILPSMDKGIFDYFFGEDTNQTDMADYFVTDIMAVAQNISSKESEALSSALANTLVYVRSSSGETGLTGLSVTLPYGDANFYKDLKNIFSKIGIDDQYIEWLGAFTGVTSTTTSYDYEDWYDDWDWDDYDDDYNWEDWDLFGEDDYWDNYDWDDWDFSDSFNQWFFDNEDDWDDDDWGWGDDDWNWDDDDWNYGDDDDWGGFWDLFDGWF